MVRLITLEEQIQESIRGPGIVGEFPKYIFSTTEQELDITPEQQYEGSIPKIPSLENWQFSYPKEKGYNPFSLSLEEFRGLKSNKVKELLREVYDLCRNLLEEAWERGVQHVIICDGKVVYESRENQDISNKTVEQLLKKHNKPCYVFSAPDIVEESNWTPVGDNDNDFYPSLHLYLGTEDTEESEIVKNTPAVCADLDTGNPYYKIFNAEQLDPTLTRFRPIHIRQGTHLGQSYTYFTERLKICVKDIMGNIKSSIYNVRIVEDWANCALLQTSPNRQGFIGRDILLDLGIKLKLDASKRITQILDVA